MHDDAIDAATSTLLLRAVAAHEACDADARAFTASLTFVCAALTTTTHFDSGPDSERAGCALVALAEAIDDNGYYAQQALCKPNGLE